MIFFRNIYNKHFLVTETYPEFSDKEKEFLCKKIHSIRTDTFAQRDINIRKALQCGSKYFHYPQLYDDFNEEKLCEAVRKNRLSEREKYFISVILHTYRWRFPLDSFFFPILTEEKYAKFAKK